MEYYKNKSAIVTGGASGIGRALCEALGEEGAHVIVADIDIDGAEKVASAVTGSGGHARAEYMDVSNEENVRDVIEKTTAARDQLHFMFNNAGFAIGAEMQDIEPEHWRKIVDVNLMGVINGSSIAYSVMTKQGTGHIINMSSLSGLIGHPTAIPYATTKSAIVGLSVSLRAEAVKWGVRVSVACPGFIQTGLFDSAVLINAEKDDVLSNIPFNLMDAGRAAEKILRGVGRNQSMIVFPFYARLLWRLYRIHPGLITPVAKKMLQDFRTSKKVSKESIRTSS